MADAERTEIALPAKVEAESFAKEATPVGAATKDAPLEEGQLSADDQYKADREKYLWFRCDCDPAMYSGQQYYWLHTVSKESRWDEPSEPYWIWDAVKQDVDPSGLQQPSTNLKGKAPATVAEPDADQEEEVIERYNPKIHGNYDPTQPYARYHEKRREAQRAAELAAEGAQPEASGLSHEEHSVAMATFNRATGAFQSADRNSERHSDSAKSHRQLSAFFDVDAAAAAHSGKSLKEERRNQVHSKKQIQKFNAKKVEKKRKKQMAFLLS